MKPYLQNARARADLTAGWGYLELGRAADGIGLLREAVGLREQLLDRFSPALADAQIALAQGYIELNRMAEARRSIAAAQKIVAHHPVLGQYHKALLAGVSARMGVRGREREGSYRLSFVSQFQKSR